MIIDIATLTGSLATQSASACTWGHWWTLPAAFLMAVAGIIGHELTHAVVMWPIAEDLDIEISGWQLSTLYVESTFKNTSWRHRWADLAGIAPMLIATTVLGVWLWVGLPATSNVLAWGAIHAMIWYGYLGGIDDYSRSHSVERAGSEPQTPVGAQALSDGGQAFMRRQQRLLSTLTVAAAAAGIGLLYDMACTGVVSSVGWSLAVAGVGISLGAAAILTRRFKMSDLEL